VNFVGGFETDLQISLDNHSIEIDVSSIIFTDEVSMLEQPDACIR
jgi:hypothetical protein